MNDNKDNQQQNGQLPVTPAVIKKTNVFTSVVWIIPLIALIAGGWLLFKHIKNTGPEITLLMQSADGIEVNNTVIKVLSVEAGRVTRIKLQDNQKGVEVTARLNADAADLIRKDTQFWVVKPRIDQSGITGLNTLMSGSYIAFTPGKSDEKADTFTVLDIPPIAAIGQNNLRLKLRGNNSKMLSVGSPVMYENFSVGQIESANFDPKTRTVNYTIFIQSPNDQLISAKSHFWLESGVSVQTTGSGVHIEAAPIPALLSGAIAFDSPEGKENHQHVENETAFPLYNNRGEIDNLPDERTLFYTTFFKQSIRGLVVGSPVEYKGINVGSVSAIPYFAHNDSLKLFDHGWIPIRIRLEPKRMEINSDTNSKDQWSRQIQVALSRGLTATITSSNLITGGKMIELSDGPNTQTFKPFASYNGDIVVASRSGGLDDLQNKLSDLLEKLNKLPLEKTVGEVNSAVSEMKATLASANALISQPQTKNVPKELNKTLIELRQTLAGISPKSPIYGDVQNTLHSIDRTLKEAQPLVNTLKEKPNSLIFNSNIKDPIPRGSR